MNEKKSYHLDGVSSVAITSYNKYLVSGSHDGTIKVFDFNTRQLVRNFGGAGESEQICWIEKV